MLTALSLSSRGILLSTRFSQTMSMRPSLLTLLGDNVGVEQAAGADALHLARGLSYLLSFRGGWLRAAGFGPVEQAPQTRKIARRIDAARGTGHSVGASRSVMACWGRLIKLPLNHIQSRKRPQVARRMDVAASVVFGMPRLGAGTDGEFFVVCDNA